MPCDTISTAKISFKNAIPHLLEKAMENLGMKKSQWSLDADKLTYQNRNVTEQEIRTEYADQLIQTKAKQFGWSAKKQKNGKWLVAKASF